MNASSENHRNFQADVYFALATIIQAIILTGLGNEIIQIIKRPIREELVWVIITGIQSILICVSFWFYFVRDYYFGFRMIQLNAKNHFMLALTFFLTGLMQYIAFHFLNEPRKWLLFILISIAFVFLNSLYMTASVSILNEPDLKQILDESHGSKMPLILFALLIIILVIWYGFSVENNPVLRITGLSCSAALIITFIIDAITIFEKQLKWK